MSQMSVKNPAQLLDQIKSLHTMSVSGSAAENESGGNVSSFVEMFASAMNQINQGQLSSRNLAQAFELGDQSVSFVDVMIEGKKADIQFQTLAQVRNKIVSAYQEIMSMQV